MKDAVNNEPVEDNIEVDVIGNQGEYNLPLMHMHI